MLKKCLILSDQQSNLFDKLVDYICYAHIYHPRIGIVRRRRGLISGSYFTNLIDGVVNVILITYCLVKTGQNTRIRHMSVHGDDNWLVSDSPIDIDALNKELSILGMAISVDKCHVAGPRKHEVHFLGSL